MSIGVFLSHTLADKHFAHRLAADLRSRGARVWIDDAEINVGDSLIEKIRDGIDQMDYLAVVLTPDSVQSDWVRREVDVAMNQEIAGRRVKVLPLLLKQCEFPGFLEGKRYADFTSPRTYSRALAEVLRALGLEHTPSGADPASIELAQLSVQRLRGCTSVGRRLRALVTSGQGREFARLELAYHQFSRLREHRSLGPIRELQSHHGVDPFVERALALLLALCHVARGDTDEATNVIHKAPSSGELSPLQRGFLALQEGVVRLARGDAYGADRAWKEAARTEASPGAPYPPFYITKPFDRSVLRTLLGPAPIGTIVASLPLSTYRGAAHMSAVVARVLRKSEAVVRSIENYGRNARWTHVPRFHRTTRRLRDYEVSVLSNSGTLFA